MDLCFRLLMEGVTDYAIVMLDKAARVVNWNAGAERIFGWQAEEIVGQHVSRFYPERGAESEAAAMELELAVAAGTSRSEGWRLSDYVRKPIELDRLLRMIGRYCH